MRRILPFASVALLALGWVPGEAAPKRVVPAKRSATATPGQSKGITLRVNPSAVTLLGPRTEQQVLVTAVNPDGSHEDVTRSAVFTTSSQAITVEQGRIRARQDGRYRVAVRYTPGGGRAVQAQVSVMARSTTTVQPVSFVNEVIPVLTQAGCNQGTCHGAQYGKGGLKLSLLGFDPESDYYALVRDAEGRRVTRSQPERSLLLSKPLMQIPHAGGKRLTPGTWQYRVLTEWLAGGFPGPLNDERRVARVEVEPAVRVMEPGQAQQLRVTAVYDDGSTEDVTRAARFDTNNEPVATVEPGGRVKGHQSGMAPLMIRYQGYAAVARTIVPYAKVTKRPSFPHRNLIDPHIDREWKRLGLLPSEPCSDAEFIRRAYLDSLGTLPTPAEVEAFLAECDTERQAGNSNRVQGSEGAEGRGKRNSGKVLPYPNPRPSPNRARERLVARLLERPEWVDYWTLYFGDILRNNRQLVGDKGMWAFRSWIQDCLRTGKPYNEMVRELIDVSGSVYRNGAANYYSVARNPEDLAKTTSQVFLGIRIECAECHNHPFEKWTQKDYYSLAAYFARVKYKGFPGSGRFGGDQLVLIAESGEIKHPRTGEVMLPKPLEGKAREIPGEQRLADLANWLADPTNPFVARNIVNRIWGRIMGRGIIDPVDDVRASNPPTHPELLDALTRDFVSGGFNLKQLMRRILTSGVYQLSSQATAANQKDTQYYSYYRARRLAAEPLLDAICSVTGIPEKFAGLPAGYRAISLPDSRVPSALLETFGRPAREALCECERNAEPNLSQTLLLTNGEFLQKRISAKESIVNRMLAAGRSDEEILREIYLRAFSRAPRPDELVQAKGFIVEAGSRKQGLEDLLWTVLNSREFLLQH